MTTLDPPRPSAFTAPGAPDPDLVVTTTPATGRLAWSVANRGDRPRPVWAVHAAWDLGPGPAPVRVLCHGWQSWSPTWVGTVGADHDPATPAVPGWLRRMHHADPTPVPPGVLRSEWVTVVRRPGRPLQRWGFLGGDRHDGTFLVSVDERDHLRLTAVAHLGGAVLGPGEERPLHDVAWEEGDDHHDLLTAWAAAVGRAGAARTGAPHQVGWCSWYQWFGAVTERDVLATVAAADAWPFEVLQVDDGYQRAIGDWLTTAEAFPSGPAHVAGAITAAGRRAGIWLAPAFAAAGSDLARHRPGWLARTDDGRPLVGHRNPAWGGDTFVLDTTLPDVVAHLEGVAAELVAMGFTYLKLDFLYGAHAPGRYADPARTPAERVRAGLEAVRRGAGPDTFLLGCGCPLLTAVGVVDGMRIGPDVDPSWHPAARFAAAPGRYRDVVPATRNAWAATLARSFLHRRLWSNDPDCLLLRTERTDLTAAQVDAWAQAVALSGGSVMVSDDLSLLAPDARSRLAAVVAQGRAVDAASRAGPPPRCDDLLDAEPPRRLTAGGQRLVLVDAEAGRATLTPA